LADAPNAKASTAKAGKRMLKVTMASVGKDVRDFYSEGVAEYARRLSRHCRLSLVCVEEHRLPASPTAADERLAMEAEARSIAKAIGYGAAWAGPGQGGAGRVGERGPARSERPVIAFDRCGRGVTSVGLSEILGRAMAGGASGLAMVIGGHLGLAPGLLDAADDVLSLSAMTFPHRMARLIVAEQLYRAFKILSGERYHR